MGLSAHGVTHTGRRAANEDSLLVDLSHGLFVVADGMGGHAAGEVASRLAVTTIGELMTRPDAHADRLCDAVRRANDRILASASDSADYSGMGTTVTAAVIRDGHVAFVSVGDSRLYLWRHGDLTQLTRDDSWLAHARATGTEITDDEATRHPMRHVLTEVVGVRPHLSAELQVESLEAGDLLLLCSDGLHGVVTTDVIGATLQQAADAASAAERLVQEALERGTTDNVTAIVVRY
ncbi:MAG TPA: protein phosphatase 2C domain-containing protein [Vicinamibacterales bacterium]|nr:protein phosphatase 2C domain-containing protein [Vicinamibacterales bacterium]